MNKRMKKDWLVSLRNGKYTQCRNELRDATGYCCLGVLCEIEGYDWSTHDNGDMGEMFQLPDKIHRTSKLTEDEENELVKLNDEDEKDFIEIANYIEDNL